MLADYKKLGVLKQQFPDTPVIALTATATTQASKAPDCVILYLTMCGNGLLAAIPVVSRNMPRVTVTVVHAVH
jgi:hypothetical protein